MIELLAMSIEPVWLGWVLALLAPAALVFSGFTYFKLDGRYVRKADALHDAESLAKERQSEVEHLKQADARIEKKLGEMSDVVKLQDAAAQASIVSLRSEMNAGFTALTKTVGEGVLSLSREVALIQGRLAGANGVKQQEVG